MNRWVAQGHKPEQIVGNEWPVIPIFRFAPYWLEGQWPVLSYALDSWFEFFNGVRAFGDCGPILYPLPATS